MILYHGSLDLSRVPRFAAYCKVYRAAAPVDRTGTITFPTKMKSIFLIPEMRPFTDSYDEVCARRAIELSELAEILDVGIYIFWSGGIDSTCALVSFLRYSDPSRLTVLLNENSIREYPRFYSQYVRNLRQESSDRISSVFTEDAIVVNGEGNDQIFGSDIIEHAISLFGFTAVCDSLERELITSLFQHRGLERRDAEFCSGLVGRLIETASVDIMTNYDLLWWINFAIKWQTTYMRSLICSRSPLEAEHVKTYYHPFFHTPDFQLWSMNNMDKKIRGDWRSYKWPCKDVIYHFTHDEDYRDNKVKYGSLQHVMRRSHKFIDESFNFLEEADWYQPSDFD